MNQQFLPTSHPIITKKPMNAYTIKRIEKGSILLLLVLFCFCTALHAQVNFQNGLVAYYPFNGNVNDESGNGKKNGDVFGASLTLDRFGRPNAAFKFDGINDYIALGNWFNMQNFTISLWVKLGETQVNYAGIIDNNHTDYRSWVVQQNVGQINKFYFGRVNGVVSNSFSLNPNQWHQIVISHDSISTCIYINNKLFQAYPSNNSIKIKYDGTQQLTLGHCSCCGRYLNGSIDDVRFYNRALSEAEILELYNETPIKGIHNLSPKIADRNEKYTDIDISAYPIPAESKVELVNGNNSIKPDSILERNTYNIKARFSFKNKQLGVYDALLISANDTMRLEKCFTLIYLSEAIEPTDTDNDGLRNITSFGHIVWITQHNESWSWNYELDNDLDASETEYWNDGKGLNTITTFLGIFDGQSHKIRNLYYSRSSENNIAFIGTLASGGIVRNLGLANCSITGTNYLAGLVANNNGTISNCYFSGTIAGNNNVGGITGNNSGTIKSSYNSALITGNDYVGGLAGNSTSSSIISKSYNQGKVIGKDINIAGIVGSNRGKIIDCYNAGSIIGAGEVAGIAGWNYGTISNVYNRGYVNGAGNAVGAIIGINSGSSLVNSYSDKETSGGITSQYGVAGTKKSTAEMKTQSTYANWDFTNTWEILSTLNDGYPQLSWAKTTSLIKSYSPERVANSGSATVTFEGINFDSETKVCLYKSGQDTIKADSIYTSDTYCSAKFNFNNAALGSWNILVEYPDTTVTIKNGLMVEVKKEGVLKVEVLGADKMRLGRPTSITIRVTNTGNEEIKHPFISIAAESIDKTFSISTDILSDGDKEFCKIIGLDVNQFFFPDSKNLSGDNTLKCRMGTFCINSLAPYSSTELQISLKSNADISITTWQADYTIEDYQNKIAELINKNKLKSASVDNYKCINDFIDCYGDWMKESLSKINPYDQMATFVMNIAGAVNPYVGNVLLSGDIVNSMIDMSKLNNSKEKNINDGLKVTSRFMSIGTNLIVAGLVSAKILTLSTAVGVVTVGTIGGLLVADGVYLAYDGNKAFHSCGDLYITCSRPFQSPVLKVKAVSSFDPNDKYGYRSPSGGKYFNEDKTNFTYVIEFENKETATAAAQEVFVTDTLDSNVFDIQSFKAGSIKIGGKTYDASFNARDAKWTIDMRPDMNYITYVTLKLDTATGVAQWYFRCVDPVTLDWPTDPLAGFLPPNDSTGRGQGSVSFTINLKKGLSDGATLNNHATIVFDTNDPIKTPTWTNKKDVIVPTSYMYEPDVVADNLAAISWKGEDNKNGSGVFCYNLFMKKGDEGYTQLLTRSSKTSTDFEFEKGVKYSFYVTAVDSAENAEVKTNVPEIVLYEKTTDAKTLQKKDEHSVNVFPNPNDGMFTVTTTYEGESQLSVTSISGQKIFGPIPFRQSTQVNLKGRGKGIYLCIVKNSNQVITKKIEIK